MMIIGSAQPLRRKKKCDSILLRVKIQKREKEKYWFSEKRSFAREMDVGKGWPTHRCTGAGQDNTIINRIMLRFRPIAPKPVQDGSVTGSTPGENKAEIVTKPRAKRKYVRVNKNRKCKINKEQEKIDLNLEGTVVTLRQLQDIGGGMKVSPGIGSSQTVNFSLSLQEQPTWMQLDKSENNDNFKVGLPEESDRGAVVRSMRVAESWLVVEGMTETWLDVGILGSTDTERMRNLEMDTCPGLISDGLHRVQWVNLAYRRMVNAEEGGINTGGGGGGEPPPEVIVWLVVKENIPVVWPVFACTVRVVYTWRKEKHSRTMPCDVWKMDFGGFAWRLDAKAALSLGR